VNFNQTPGASGRLHYEAPCAMTFTTMNGDKLTRPMNASAVKKYSVKNKKLNKSQILKSGLDKNERLGGLKTQKGRSRQKLETRTKMIILID